MNIYLYIIRSIAFYQAQKYTFPYRTLSHSFNDLIKGTCIHNFLRIPNNIEVNPYTQQEEDTFDNYLSNAIENPYKHKAIWYTIANP
jgi:hypothetical protein